MTDIKVIQPEELDTQDFVFEGGLFKLAKPYKSNDAENALQSGTDGGVFLPKSELKRYRIVPDAETNSLNLYEYTGSNFDKDTATLLDSVNLATIAIEVDDVAISGAILTFTDVQSGEVLSFDTALPLYSVLHQSSNSTDISGDGKSTPLVVDLIIDPDAGNLVKVTTSGVMVDSDDIVTLFNNVIQESMDFTNDTTNNSLKLTIGDTTKTVSTSRLVNSSGAVLGYILT